MNSEPHDESIPLRIFGRMTTQEFTVKEFAYRERVDTRTVYRWVQKGAVTVRRTPGGGVRIVERRQTGSS